jgi:hypothetical protein
LKLAHDNPFPLVSKGILTIEMKDKNEKRHTKIYSPFPSNQYNEFIPKNPILTDPTLPINEKNPIALLLIKVE